MTVTTRPTVRPARCVRGDGQQSSADLDAVVTLARKGWDRWAETPSDWIDADWVERMVTAPDVAPDLEDLVVELDGRLVAFLNIRPRPPFTEVEVSAHIDPDLVGPELVAVVLGAVDAATTAAVARGADPDSGAALVFFTFAGEPATRVLENEGFTFSRAMFLMRRQLDTSITVLPLPAEVTIHPIDIDRDLADLTLVAQAFEDHRGDFALDEASMRHDLTGATSRPELSLLARDDQGPVAGVVVSIDDVGGVVEMLMTLRRARGRGIGSALLTRAFVGLRDAGQTEAYLMVDATNPTGALGVYERAGMTVADRFAMWSRPLSDRSV